MNKSKLLISKIINGNKLEFKHYNSKQPRGGDLSLVMSDGRLDLAHKIIKKFNLKGNVLELGSGYSWMTAEISKSKEINECYCCDFSEEVMKVVVPKVFEYLKADTSKITRIIGDFSSVPVNDNFFDFIIFEASLHHVVDYEKTFNELRRILKPEGIIICTRERVLPENVFESEKAFLEHTKTGILERIFSLQEWRFICEMNYFHFSIMPLFFYKNKNRKLKDWIKYFLNINPFFRKWVAKKFNCIVFIIRPKAYKPIENNFN